MPAWAAVWLYQASLLPVCSIQLAQLDPKQLRGDKDIFSDGIVTSPGIDTYDVIGRTNGSTNLESKKEICNKW